MNELYNSLDLYIVGSRVEGGPQSIMECALIKVPIISTDVGIASQILNKSSIFDEKILDAKPDINHAYKMAKEFTLPNGIKKFEKCSKKYMKISIGTNTKDGPWGGGNLLL